MVCVPDIAVFPVAKSCDECHKTFYDNSQYRNRSTCCALPESKGSVDKRSEDDDAEHRGDSWGRLLLGLVVGVFFGWWIAGALT